MTISQMLSQSVLLTVLGMCVVFVFLIIMIWGMNLLQFVVHAFKLDKDTKTETKNKSVAPAPSVASVPVQNVDNNAVIAAIAAAVYEKESI